MDEDIVQLALNNLNKETGIVGRWTERRDIDGEVKLVVNDKTLHYFVEVKREVRRHQLDQLLRCRKQFTDVLLVAEHIFPAVKAELRELNFPYLETNGNVFIKRAPLWLWIDTNRKTFIQKETRNRAFTKTGLKVLFYLLLDRENVNLPQRVIAEKTGVALGNIPLVLNGLKEAGYLLRKGKKTYLWEHKEDLIHRWINEYEISLKPHLLIGTFHLEVPWQELEFDGYDEAWGGETAGDLYTDYLRPEEYILFTRKSRTDFIKKYRLRPGTKGNLKLYKMFWTANHEKPYRAAPPLLVYADLKLRRDKRCREVATMIWNEYIQPNI